MGRVLYGMPTLIECDSLDETIKLCNELKLDFIEINMNLPQYQNWPRHIIYPYVKN